MKRATIPPRQDRRGFYEFFALSLIISVVSFVRYLLLCSSEDGDDIGIQRRLCIVFAIIGIFGFITAEGLSRPPHNGPHKFVKNEVLRGKRDEDEKVLVCLGDSLTQGACSANWVDGIIPSLMAKQPSKLAKLKVVNAGQNSICTQTILHERVDHVISCQPDFIFIMIGTNDVMAMYREDWAKDKMRLWNLPEIPTDEVIMRNLTCIVKRLLDQTNACIGLATLPPMGEDVNCPANKLIQRINSGIRKMKHDIGAKEFSVIDINDALLQKIKSESGNRHSYHTVDKFLQYAVVMGIFHCVFNVRWTTLSYIFTGNVVLSESLHLNEIGADIIKDKVVDWLMIS